MPRDEMVALITRCHITVMIEFWVLAVIQVASNIFGHSRIHKPKQPTNKLPMVGESVLEATKGALQALLQKLGHKVKEQGTVEPKLIEVDATSLTDAV